MAFLDENPKIYYIKWTFKWFSNILFFMFLGNIIFIPLQSVIVFVIGIWLQWIIYWFCYTLHLYYLFNMHKSRFDWIFSLILSLLLEQKCLLRKHQCIDNSSIYHLDFKWKLFVICPILKISRKCMYLCFWCLYKIVCAHYYVHLDDDWL